MCEPFDVPEPEVALELTVSQARVLGALLEKEFVTPDAYPMTANALVVACSQTTNRDPVIRLEASTVEMAALTLKSKGLVRVVYPGSGERATKYRQVADTALVLSPPDRALLCLLLLRGAQTAAELKTRADRLHSFPSTAEVESALRALAEREVPLAVRVDRLPGQKEARWIQLLEAGAETRATASSQASAGAPAGGHSVVATLERRIEALEARLEALVAALGDRVQLDRVRSDATDDDPGAVVSPPSNR